MAPFLERVKLFGVHSFCFLPLTTARRRLGALAFASNQAGAYDAADLDFLQQVANQVAVTEEAYAISAQRIHCGRREGDPSAQRRARQS